jgi:hypothetical protein
MGKSPLCSLDRKMGEPQSQSGRWEEEIFFPLQEIEMGLLGCSYSGPSLYSTD